jgi:phosphate transport system permease protein
MSGSATSVLERPLPYDPTAPLTASGNLRRRAAVDRFVQLVATTAALVAVTMLAIVVYGVVARGAPALSLSFVTTNPSGLTSGGIFNSLLGTAEIVACASLIAIPIGVLTGLYLTEFAGARSGTGRVLKLALDIMQGLPTIVVGLFVFGLLVLPLHKQSGIAGAVALSIVMLPLIARSSQEVLLLVPGTLREAADALGVSRWRTVLRVIVPAASGGILTGAILAAARGAGETAPVLLCDSIFNPNTTNLNILGGVPNVPMFIYTSFDLPIKEAITRVWGAAFVLVAFILIANVVARLLLARTRAKMGAG